MTLDDLARALLAGIDAGGWHVFPPRDPANLPTMEEYTASRMRACRFAVAAVVLALAEDIEAEVWPGQGARDMAGGRLLALIAEARATAGEGTRDG